MTGARSGADSDIPVPLIGIDTIQSEDFETASCYP